MLTILFCGWIVIRGIKYIEARYEFPMVEKYDTYADILQDFEVLNVS